MQPLSTGNARPITIASTPGAAIHASVAGKVDEVTLMISNTDAAAHVLSFAVSPPGGGGKDLEVSLAAREVRSLTFLVTNGDELWAFGDIGDVLIVLGSVVRTG